MIIEIYIQTKTKNPAVQKIAQARWLIQSVQKNGQVISKDGAVSISNATSKRAALQSLVDALSRFNKAAVIKIYVSDDKKLRSSRWCTGGAYGSCWSNSLSPVSADEPLEFEELDNLLEEIAPNVTFLHYKKIRSQCVKTEESYERDYYGGGCSYLNWVCDLEKLYDLLEQQGYIEEE